VSENVRQFMSHMFIIKDEDELYRLAVRNSASYASDEEQEIARVITRGDLPALKEYVNSDKVDFMCKDKHGRSKLHTAVERGHLPIVKYMLGLPRGHGVSVNTVDNLGWTPLHVACSAGNLDMIELLLAFPNEKPDLSIMSNENSTVLHYFIKSYRVMKSNMNDDDNFMKNLELRRMKILLQLISGGCDLDVTNKNGETLYHVCAASGCVQELVTLSESGQLNVDINATNRFGETCLHIAARGGNLEMVKALLKLGSDPNVPGKHGTAYEVAAKAGKQEAADYLSKQENT